MVKIGILGGRLGEMNPTYPYRKWMDDVPDKFYFVNPKSVNEMLNYS